MQLNAADNGQEGIVLSASKIRKIPREQVFCGRDMCGDLEQVESREFIVTNGKGGYASLTAACSLTRSYHGLLIAALRPPLERTLLLTNLHETVSYLDHTFHLSTFRRTSSSHSKDPSCAELKSQKLPSGDIMCPLGFMHLESVRLEGTVPVFTYAILDALLEKRVWMKQGENTVFVSYHLLRGSDVVDLTLSAYVNHRDHHQRTRADAPHFDMKSDLLGSSTVRVLFNSDDKQSHTTLHMHLEKGVASLEESWVNGIVLEKEDARGYSRLDSAVHAANFNACIFPGSRVAFFATSESRTSFDLSGADELQLQHAYELKLLEKYDKAGGQAKKRRRSLTRKHLYSVPVLGALPLVRANATRSSPLDETDLSRAVHQLVLAADQFIITRAGGHSIVAGYHWFTDWARDVRIFDSFETKSS